jgi:hypothetical protein
MITAPPTEEAIDAMVLALQTNGVNLYAAVPAGQEPVTPSLMRSVLATALMAGAEHLVPEPSAWVKLNRQCRICGCTDDEACPGGCSWSQPEICSTCALRQQVADAQYLATLRAQERASDLQAQQAEASLEGLIEARALIQEQAEVAKLQREDLAGVTWRQAVAIAGERTLGAILVGNNVEHVQKTILAEAEWFAHYLGNPPVVF